MKTLRLLLLPLSFVYWVVVMLRNWFFDIGLLRVTDLSVPVISVGNISTGGTGKTPFVEVVVRKIQSRGRNPAVVSRGYGRKTKGYVLVSDGVRTTAVVADSGDEPYLLAQQLNGVPIVVAEKRAEGAKRVLQDTRANVIVLDDGFQHRYLHRTLDVVLLTAEEVRSSEWLLPAGNRRETVGALKRADLVVVSRCTSRDDFDKAVEDRLSQFTGKIAGVRMLPGPLRRISSGESLGREAATGMTAMTFSGIGNPRSLMDSAREFGCLVNKNTDFSDHHWYSEKDLIDLRSEFVGSRAQFVITTEKDLVRLQAAGKVGEKFLHELPVYALEMKVEFLVGEDLIDRCIERALK
jgi:tetraacyldisaccharide 4'-kinase